MIKTVLGISAPRRRGYENSLSRIGHKTPAVSLSGAQWRGGSHRRRNRHMRAALARNRLHQRRNFDCCEIGEGIGHGVR
jgi:hypothetical protein